MAQDIQYEILTKEAAADLRAAFQASVAAKARDALPCGASEAQAETLLPLLENLVIAALGKGLEIKQAELAELAAGGAEAISKRAEEIDEMLHLRTPFISKFPSPALSPEQREAVAAAAAKRQEDETVSQVFGDNERLYLTFNGAAMPPSGTQNEIEAALEKMGYRVVDYNAGYATDRAGKQRFKIGKLLKDDIYLAEKYRTDGTRGADSLMAVVSRNADDIARLSTGRAWSSCMGSGGLYFNQYVPEEVRKGSLVAYLITEKDPEILNPLARILIKPYVQKISLKSSLKLAASAMFMQPARRPRVFVANGAYGLRNENFTAAIAGFVEDNLNSGKQGEFRLPWGVYADGLPAVQFRPALSPAA